MPMSGKSLHKATILDVHLLYTHLGQFMSDPNLLMVARGIALDPNYTTYIEDGMCVTIQRIDERTGRLHVYVNPEKRGKAFMVFLNRCSKELTGVYEEVLMEPPSSMKHIHRLIKYMGVPEVSPGVYSYKVGGNI